MHLEAGGMVVIAQVNSNPKFWMRDVLVRLNVITLMAVHGNLLLALRHPMNIGESREMVVKFTKDLGDELVLLGAFRPEQLIAAYQEEALQGAWEFNEDLDELKARLKEKEKMHKELMQMAAVSDSKISITDTLPPIPPVFWKDEIEGKMAPIVENFFDDVPLGPNDLKILQWYMYQWIAALPGKPENYQDVRNMNQDELKKYLHDVLLPMGIDPF